MSSYSKFWSFSSEITGFLKGSAGDQVTGKVVGNRWTHTGVKDQGCLGRSGREAHFRKSAHRGRKRKVGMGSSGSIVGTLFVEEDKRKAGMGGYLHMGPSVLALDSFYGLTSNFSYPLTCLEAIFLFISTFQCFSYLWTSIDSKFLGLYHVTPVLRVCIGSPRAVTLLPPFTS
jgi:hypothetical protein